MNPALLPLHHRDPEPPCTAKGGCSVEQSTTRDTELIRPVPAIVHLSGLAHAGDAAGLRIRNNHRGRFSSHTHSIPRWGTPGSVLA
jgi:hypothetical protein